MCVSPHTKFESHFGLFVSQPLGIRNHYLRLSTLKTGVGGHIVPSIATCHSPDNFALFFYSIHLFLPSPILYYSSPSSSYFHIHCTLLFASLFVLLSIPLIKSFVLLPCPSLCLPLSLPPCGLVLRLSFTFTELFGYTTFSSPFPPLQVRSPLLNFNTIPVWLMNK